MDPSPQPEATLLNQLGAELGSGELSPQERALILRLAREVAHAGEHQDAPLATFMIGRYIQKRASAGVSVAAALTEAAEQVRRLIPVSEDGEASS